MKSKSIIGWRETVGLPDFGVDQIKAKIDTGAKTSSLHAFGAKHFTKDGEDWVSFKIHPRQRHKTPVIVCKARVIDIRPVVSSNGAREKRFFIKTRLKMGPYVFPIELSLSSRDDMGYRLLVGRQALNKRFVVDSGTSYTLKTGRRKTP